MPIVDISGLSSNEQTAKDRIRERIKDLYHAKLKIPSGGTTVTFIDDSTAGEGSWVHVMARLYSKKFMGMDQSELDILCDDVVQILEQEGGHDFNEVFSVPIMTIRGGLKPYKPVVE